MITLTAKINLLSGDNSVLAWDSSYSSSAPTRNNISSAFKTIVGEKKSGSNPFLLDSSKLGSGATFSDGVNYFIGDQLSSDTLTSGVGYKFANAYDFAVKTNDTNKKITSITIAFDKGNNRHPNYIRINNQPTQYKDDDAIFTIQNTGEPQMSLSVQIDNWNTPNAPLVITGIYVEVAIEIDRRNLISLETTIYDRSDLKLPSFGIISNKGNIEFNDTNGEVRDYAEQLLLEKGLKCEIRLNNTLVDGASETIGVFETNEWDYDNDNRVVSVSLKDDLEEWQEINVDEISYDPRKTKHKPFQWLYEHLWGITNPKYPMVKYYDLESETKKALQRIIQYPMLKAGTLWQQWTKLCEVCQLHIYKNSDGIVECKYNGGN